MMEKDYAAKRGYKNLKKASDYDRLRFESAHGRLKNWMKRRAIEKALSLVGPIRSILDLPCGTGRFVPFLAGKGYKVIGADISYEMMTVSKKKTEFFSNCSYLQCDAEQIPMRDNSIDCVLSIRFMFHLPPSVRKQSLLEMRRITRRWVIVDFRHATVKTLMRKIAIFFRLGEDKTRLNLKEIHEELSDLGFNVDRVIRVLPLFSEKVIFVCEKRRRLDQECFAKRDIGEREISVLPDLRQPVGVRRMKTINDFLAFKTRGILGGSLLLPMAIAIAFSDPLIPEDSFFDFAMDLCGWIFFLLYLTFRLWATLYVGGRKDSELQTAGPYALTRNPLYFGSLCFGLSAIFFFKSLSLLLIICIVWIFYSLGVIKSEERHLENKFGEAFKDYVRRTPRLIPSSFPSFGDGFVSVNLRALKIEARRLWFSAFFPVLAEIVMHLRMAPWWPHWFRLP